MTLSSLNTGNKGFIDRMLIWLIAFCALGFFTLLIPQTAVKASVLMGALLIIFILILHLVYGKVPVIKKHFILELGMMFIALITSAFAAEFFHDQSLLTTLIIQHQYYIFLFYILLHRMRPDPDELLNMFVWLGYIYAFIYFLQYLAYPTEILSSRVHQSRGTIRILMPGSEFMVTSWFILLSRYFITKKIKYIVGLIPFIMVVILMATRQVMASIALLTLMNILFSRALKSKLSMFVVIALAIIPFYFLFQGVFDQIIEVTQRQQADMEENIRLVAARYFLFDLNPNPVWILTGNGMPGPHSEYGRFIFRLGEELGYHQSDVGIIGDFSKFGILYALAQFIFLFKMIFYRCREKYSFIRYDAIMILMTFFTGSGFKASNIIMLCCIFYMIDADRQKT